ncbi:hypothetical protein D3874_17005 [Oleomonas cavernae]|uniref:FMN-binding domain-containing protein n=1 Tax=Oleomonas cavernae TaxID=2320859 RepID=A0A418WEP3_9PROT|nr:hypothetical protein [Oleomonas cavernae]RJF88498.1 hypothetical protein D3874_17005 [Oleomonas cavernae]
MGTAYSWRQAIAGIVAGLLALLLVFGLAGTAVPARAGELTRDALATQFSPPFSLGQKDPDLPVYPFFRSEGGADKLAGYVFESVDFAPIPGFSGTPPDLLVVLGVDGSFQSVSVVSQHEPVFLHGLGPEPLNAFVAQYAGKTLAQNVKVGIPRERQSAQGESGTNEVIDGVAKATASVRIINESVLGAALAVARAKLGISGPPRAPAHPRPEVEAMDFAGLERAGLAVHLVLRERDVEKAFAGTAGERTDPLALRDPDGVFADLWVAYLNIPTVGANLLGAADWADMAEGLDGAHALFVAVGGATARSTSPMSTAPRRTCWRCRRAACRWTSRITSMRSPWPSPTRRKVRMSS